MTTPCFSLDDVEIAAPCSADWEAMTGDARVRACGLCRKNVYDLSALTRADAERLVQEKEGKLCVRFFRRADGRLLTADCPVGLAARVRRRVSRTAAAVLAFFGLAGSAAAIAKSDLDDTFQTLTTPKRRPLMGVPVWRPPVTKPTPNVQNPSSNTGVR